MDEHFGSSVWFWLFGFRFSLVLVLSTAVLVLVLDYFFGDRLIPLNQASQHRNDAFQFRFPMDIGFAIDRITHTQHVVDRSGSTGRWFPSPLSE